MLRFLGSLVMLVVRVVIGIALLPFVFLFSVFSRNRNLVNFEIDDAGIEAAKAEARRTVNEFIARLERAEGISHQAVKAELVVEGGGSEHVWVSDVRYEDGMFVGAIGNTPVRATGFRLGEIMRVQPTQISDWSYVEDGRLVGGYTIRHIRSRMSERERRSMDENLPFSIEEAA
jgi:uncharacterized protein YegJ (DUF2314 family)